MSLDIQDKGIGTLKNGTVQVKFNKNYSEILDDSKPIIVTVTPIGESNGVHIVTVDKYGFTIKENNNGNSNVNFNWIVIAEKKSNAEPVAEILLNESFDSNVDEVMHDDNVDGGKAIWSENGEIHFDNLAPQNPIKIENFENQIITKKPKEKRK